MVIEVSRHLKEIEMFHIQGWVSEGSHCSITSTLVLFEMMIDVAFLVLRSFHSHESLKEFKKF